MEDINKRIHEAAAALAKVKAGACVFCHGTGVLDNGVSHCEHCATLREIAGQCWHEVTYIWAQENLKIHKHIMNSLIYMGHELTVVIGHKRVKPMGFECSCNDIWKHRGLGSTADLIRKSIERSNPTYTVQTMRTLLEELGEWEGFTKWNEGMSRFYIKHGYHNCSMAWDTTMAHLAISDILTSDPLMRRAVDAYLEYRISAA